MPPTPGNFGAVSAAALALAGSLFGAAARQPDEAVEIVASRTGFRPKAVSLRKGETARLALKTADGEHCFAVDALRVEKRIVKGRTVLLDVTPDKTGTFPFYCCLESGEAAETERGRLVVTE